MQPDNPGPSNNAATADAMRILPPNLVTPEFDFNATLLISHPLKLRFQPRPTPRIRKKDKLRSRYRPGLVEGTDLSSGLLLTSIRPVASCYQAPAEPCRRPGDAGSRNEAAPCRGRSPASNKASAPGLEQALRRSRYLAAV